jgi:hypothetical protein
LITGDEAPVATPDEDVLIQRVRDIVREELRAATVIAAEEEVGGEVGPIEPAVQILAPVVARIEPGRPHGETVTQEQIVEMEKRLRPRKRKAG